MFDLKTLALSDHTLAVLARYLERTGDPRPLEDVVELAIRAWLDLQGDTLHGYQWKSLFLPEGTQLRLRVFDKYHVACVQGDKIMYAGRSVSPRQFVLAAMGCVRNAWKEVWLRCPGDGRWHLADVRRRLLRHDPRRALPHAPAPERAPSAAEAAGVQAAAATPPASAEQRAEHARYHAYEDAQAAVRRHHFLRRDDLLHDSQPDLRRSKPRPGLPYIPGRPGMPERRQPPSTPLAQSGRRQFRRSTWPNQLY
ncbi:hypothetical protein [Massilia sp. TS11]|uniref:hypothetical protein n=1 Tax=Massilia sp. TS11 TaxID=2908003 RepID=UPI001EDAC1A0|nr:hypothetical protein [Massilia sp. TS11]MCG2584524.1 hypothetical protein [Massilia sp. TS11]